MELLGRIASLSQMRFLGGGLSGYSAVSIVSLLGLFVDFCYGRFAGVWDIPLGAGTMAKT